LGNVLRKGLEKCRIHRKYGKQRLGKTICFPTCSQNGIRHLKGNKSSFQTLVHRKEKKVKIELNPKFIKAKDEFVALDGKTGIMTTPPLDKDYWMIRVQLSENQAIVAFPKFRTLGIGFQIEEASWNTNLPYTFPAKKIYEHIKINKGDDSISDEECIKAIRLIQKFIRDKKT
jgi:hypothetical protein